LSLDSHMAMGLRPVAILLNTIWGFDGWVGYRRSVVHFV
jgi:hypothetical protein